MGNPGRRGRRAPPTWNALANSTTVARVKRSKQLTKKERKALKGGPGPAASKPRHIHCIACGKHLDEAEFLGASGSATTVTCAHGSAFPTCVECMPLAQQLLAEHDRTGQPVRTAAAWH